MVQEWPFTELLLPGKLEQLYEEYINMEISDVSFSHADHGHGYNLYASSANRDQVLYMNLASGKVEMVQGKSWRAMEVTSM